MKLPRNGSVLANCMLFAGGATLGVGLMFLLKPREDDSRVAAGHADPDQGRHPAHREIAREPSSNPSALIDLAAAEVDPVIRSGHLRKAGAAAAREDLARALQLARELKTQQERLDFHRGIFGVWSEEDPEAALQHAHDHLTGEIQSEAIGIIINKWGAGNPREAWLWAEANLSGALKERALTDLMIGWTRRSPEAAASWFRDSGLTDPPLITAVATTWAEQAPLAAAAWAGSLPAGIAKQTAEVAVATEWALQDAKAAVTHYTEQSSQPEGVNLAIALTDVWSSTDPVATADWISGLPPGPSRDHAAAALATIWGAQDIGAAVSWSQDLPDAAMRQKVIAQLGTTWGAIEPLKALDWLTGLPPEEATDGITGAFYAWSGTAPDQLRLWLAENPPAALADRARLSLGDVLTSSDLPGAMQLALEMESADAGNAAAARFFREWRKQDNAGALDWLDTAWFDLPAETRDRLQVELTREVTTR